MEDKEQVGRVDTVSKRRVKKLYIKVLLIFIAGFIFSSGWLVGAGKITFRSNSLSPLVIDQKTAPTDGINELYNALQSNYDGETADSAILDGLKAGLVKAAGDPYTVYLSEAEAKDFNSDLNGTFEGIGAELGKEGSFVTIIAPIKGTPAEKAGILPGDIIIEIDGESASDITIEEAVKRIRGEKGTEVKLTLIRDGAQVEVSIIRGTITIDSVEWRKEGDIGIISIARFGDDTVELTRKAATELKDGGAKKIILDMRGNPGGLLDSAVGVSSIWLQKGSTVLLEKRGGVVIKTFKTSDQPILEGVKTVVLINKGSASASEIVSGALKDNGAATFMGTTSYGKGSVQQLMPLSSGGSLKVTIARWFTPNGETIDKTGITPDTVVERTTEDIKAKLDPQLDAAIASLK